MTQTEQQRGPGRPGAISILAVGLHSAVAEALAALLEPFDFRLRCVGDAEGAWAAIDALRPHVLVVEGAMLGAAAWLRVSNERARLPSVVLCSPELERRVLTELLAAGALDALPSHILGASPSRELAEARGIFLDALRDASSARVLVPGSSAIEPISLGSELFLPARAPRTAHELPTLIALAGATGGVQALRVVLAGLPENTPGVVVAQHGSQAFIEAARIELASATRLRVRVARHGDRIEPGLVLLAPGNRHMRTVRRGGGYRVSISDGPLIARRRPSADVLLQSASEAAGSAAIGVLLSGNGQDGVGGAAALKRSLGSTFAQDEATSVALGMPSTAAAHGVIDIVAPHHHLATLLVQCAAGPRGRA